VTFSLTAVAGTNRKDPSTLDTLAAAYAEAADFAKAVSTEKEAVALLHDGETKKAYEARLKLYNSNAPFRTPK
jgi:predicted Zn-dependent protease